MTLSRRTLELLTELLGTVQVPVSHSNFETFAAELACAKRELAEALAAAHTYPGEPPADASWMTTERQ